MARKSVKPKPPATSLFKLGLDARASVEAQAAYEAARRQKYRDLFNTILGREVLADFLATVGFFSADTPHDANVANHRNGARWAGGELLRAMDADNPNALTMAVINDDVGEVFNEE